MTINSRRKGAKGEREFCEWIRDLLDLDETPVRNLEQTRSGGADILGVDPFIFEVKRVEKLSLRRWWIQVAKVGLQLNRNRTKDSVQLHPVVAYRQNRQPWRILISAKLLGLPNGYISLGRVESRFWLQKMYYNYKCQ